MSDNRYLSDSVSESRLVDAVSSQMSFGKHDSLMVLTSFIRAEYDLAANKIYKTKNVIIIGMGDYHTACCCKTDASARKIVVTTSGKE